MQSKGEAQISTLSEVNGSGIWYLRIEEGHDSTGCRIYHFEGPKFKIYQLDELDSVQILNWIESLYHNKVSRPLLLDRIFSPCFPDAIFEEAVAKLVLIRDLNKKAAS